MSTRVMSLNAELGLDPKKFSSGLNQTKSDFNKFGGSIKNMADDAANDVVDSFDGMSSGVSDGFNIMQSVATGVFTGFTTTALDVGASIVTALGGAFKTIGMMPFDVASDYDEAMGLLESRTGATGGELDALGDKSRSVWKSGFGDSITDASEMVAILEQQLGGVNDVDFDAILAGAAGLEDAFDADFNSTVAASKVLMEKFGITGDQAMDFIAKGMQDGLNASGDFVDSITEYGGLFADGGASAEEFYSTMQTGAQGGVLGTDKVADSFKEFQIRFLEGGDEMMGAVETLTGDGWGMFMDEIKSGDTTVASSMGLMLEQLRAIEDPILQNQLGVAMFGTQWEDMGASAMLAIDTTKVGMEDLEGAGGSLQEQYNTLPLMWENIKRGFMDALLPMGTQLLDSIMNVMPDIQAGFELFQTDILPIITDFVAQGIDYFEDFMSWFRDDGINQISNAWAWWQDEGWPALKNFVDDIWTRISEFSEFFQSDIMPAIDTAWAWFKETGGPAIRDFLGFIIPLITKFYLWYLDTVMGSIKIAWAWWNDVAWPIIDQFITDVRGVIEPWINDFKAAWEELAPKFEAAWDKMVAAVDRIKTALAPLLDQFSGMGGDVGLFDSALLALDITLAVIIPTLEFIVGVVEGVAWGLEKMADALDIAVGLWDQLKTILDKIDFPDVMLPGSLPPAAQGIKDIANELRMLNQEFSPTVRGFNEVGRSTSSIVNDNRQYILNTSTTARQSTVISDFNLLESIS